MVKIVTWSRLHDGRADRSHHMNVVQNLRIENVGTEGCNEWRFHIDRTKSPNTVHPGCKAYRIGSIVENLTLEQIPSLAR